MTNPSAGIWRVRVSVLNTDATIRLPIANPDDHQAYSLAGLGEDYPRGPVDQPNPSSPDPATAGQQLFYTVQRAQRRAGRRHQRHGAVDVLPAGVTYVTSYGGRAARRWLCQ